MRGRILVGTSGWLYPSWRGDFYPRGLPHARELAYRAERLPTVEVNGTHQGKSVGEANRRPDQTRRKRFCLFRQRCARSRAARCAAIERNAATLRNNNQRH
jgi:hypothetical protein